MAERERSTMIEPAIRYFEVHPIVASADCETRMQIPARILRDNKARSIMLKNLITVAKLFYLMNAVNVMVVFLGMLGIVLQGSQDSRGDWRCDWQMLALRMETSFIGNVAQADGNAVIISIAERSLNANPVLGCHFRLTRVFIMLMTIVYLVIKSKLRRRLLYSIAEKPARLAKISLLLIDFWLWFKLCVSRVSSVSRSILGMPTFREPCSPLHQGEEQPDTVQMKWTARFTKRWHSKNGSGHGGNP
ncbi:hypothetical protein G5I_13966 [Acromyrmex echinatior]|uniref:Uncharacterized protein n=1 Tax=Acromyrmex echinatior TaxID=103372 RepID=F4X6E8_ACREC|nr:hypothetical protein G5I_13966 [Acromyrmex echinatior]